MTVLALALILGSISVASAASGKVKLTDIADNANEEAIQVSYDLGIVTGTPEGAYEPTKAVNRAEFAALIARALAIPESALATYTSTTFKDTSGYGWAVPYLAFCQQKGIMKGDGYGNAMPGRTISPNEAVTMILRAIGYTDNASVLVGQWPANYVSLGQSFLIYNNVSASTQLDKANAAQMIYNGLTVQLVQVDANSTVISLWDDQNSLTRTLPRTLLTAGLDCRYVGKTVITYDDARASKINLMPKVGAYGVMYKSNKDDEVVAVTEVETEFLAGKFTFNTTTGRADKFKAVDGTEYNLNAQAQDLVGILNNGNMNVYGGSYISNTSNGAVRWSEFNYFVNGDNHPGFGNTTETLNYPNKYLYNPAGSPHYIANYSVPSKLIVGAKVSGKTILELRSVAVWDVEIKGDHFLYESDLIDGKKFNGHDFPLDYNNEVDEYGYMLEGANSLDELVADNVIYIYKNGSNKIARIEVGTETQSGVVTNVNPKDNESTVGGKILGYSPYVGTGRSDVTATTSVNNEGTALLDLYGRIYAFKLSDASKGYYALFVSYRGAGSGFIGDNTEVKLFDKEGKESVYSTTKTLNADSTLADIRTDFLNTATGSPLSYTPQLVGYKLANGNLSSLKKRTGYVTGFLAGSTENRATINKAGSIIKVPVPSASGPVTNRDYLIDSGIVVFVLAADGTYSLGSLGDIKDSDLKEEYQYILNDTGKVGAILVHETDAGAQNAFVMITNITYESDGAGGDVAKIDGLSFAKGTGATAESWLTNVTVDELAVKLNGLRNVEGLGSTSTSAPVYPDAKPYYYWFEMVKFKIGEDGKLRVGNSTELLTGDRLVYDGWGVYFRGSYETGIEKAFSVNWEAATGSAILPRDTGTAVFDSDAVYYSLNPSKAWVAQRVNTSPFNNAGPNARYIFLKTDPKDFAYDVIIRVDNIGLTLR
jgi:hypothetical protein